MSNEISSVKITDLDPSKFRFQPVKPKSKFRPLYFDLNTLIVKFPKLRIPFDSRLNTYGQSEVSISLQCNPNNKVKTDQLIDKIKEIDDYLKELAVKEKWLEGFPADIRYNSILKVPVNSKFTPTIKAKFSKYKGEIDSVFYDANSDVLECSELDLLNKLKKGTLILASIEFSGLFFNDKTWGMTTKFYNAKIYEAVPEVVEPIVLTSLFLESSDSDNESGNLEDE